MLSCLDTWSGFHPLTRGLSRYEGAGTDIYTTFSFIHLHQIVLCTLLVVSIRKIASIPANKPNSATEKFTQVIQWSPSIAFVPNLWGTLALKKTTVLSVTQTFMVYAY